MSFSLLFSHHSLDNLHIAPLHLAEPHIRRYLSAEATPASVTAASPMRLCPNTNARGLTTIVVEQVFHHPPITAYYIANPSRGVTLEGRNAQKTFFSGKVALSAAWCPRLKRAHFSGGNIIVKQVIDSFAAQWHERGLSYHPPAPTH